MNNIFPEARVLANNALAQTGESYAGVQGLGEISYQTVYRDRDAWRIRHSALCQPEAPSERNESQSYQVVSSE